MRTTEQQNNRQLIAHLAGTIDVLAGLLELPDQTDTQRLQRMRPLIRKCKKHQDEWFAREERDERVVQ